MGTFHDTPRAAGAQTGPPARTGDGGRGPLGTAVRFLPALAALAVLVAALAASDTPVDAMARYAFYTGWGVLLPGTLLYRSLRRAPHTLVEDLTMGAVTGLVLELAAWAVFMPLGLAGAMTLWPLLVVVPFAAVPRLRRHWWVRGYTPVPRSWAWAVAGTVALTTGYLFKVYLDVVELMPANDASRQFVDISYQMSLAGNAKHSFPPTLPQVAGEPLQYHWFAFVHEAMTSLVGHLDLPVVQLRLMIPALCALTMLVAAVVAWRLSGRAWAGPIAGLLLFAVGEFNGGHGQTPFGSPQTTLMVWGSVSMTYSQPLLLALIGVAGDALRRTDRETGPDRAPLLGGRAVYVLAVLFAFSSSAAKATSIPVTLAGLALAGLAGLVAARRVPWTVVRLGVIVGAAQLFSTAVIFAFKTYGLAVDPFSNIRVFWADPQDVRSSTGQLMVVALVWFAFLVNTQLRVAGAVPLLWHGRMRLEPVQWFLLGGAVAGPAAFIAISGWNAGYFTHAGLAFGVLLSAWGYCEAWERAKLSRRGRVALGAFAVAWTALMIWLVGSDHDLGWLQRVDRAIRDLHPGSTGFLRALLTDYPGRGANGSASGLFAIVAAGLTLVALAAVCAVLWWALSRKVRPMRGRGGIVLLTAALLAATPTLVLDLPKPTWGPTVWGALPLPAGKVEAARWLRAHSDPADVVATNEHCWSADDFKDPSAPCTDYRDFALSAYAERSVLVEGWGFAPRVMAGTDPNFWDQDLLKLNDEAIGRPTPALLAELHDRHHVRYLFVNRRVGAEGAGMEKLATKVFDNGRIGIYRLG
ncbi:hypothetical protein ACIQBJ_23795 [Kitasatospora sp. NPDC088391]|uniref:hypothetical protein n=1 Tax=Kitasatospora sp. NPDC088391 TaxID=3364074 RepID=UPI00382A3E43